MREVLVSFMNKEEARAEATDLFRWILDWDPDCPMHLMTGYLMAMAWKKEEGCRPFLRLLDRAFFEGIVRDEFRLRRACRKGPPHAP